MADTPNHEYNVPDQGDENWHEPLNENFEAFEVDIELRDQEGNLGDYTPTEGAKFLATDTGVVYVGDGSDWTATFVHPAHDDAADQAQFDQTVRAPTVDTDSLTGGVTGGQSLTDIAGTNLSINNGQLDASTGGGGGISNLSGGDGIDPANIGDGDTLSVAWGDASDLDSDGNVTGGGNWTVTNNLLEPSDGSVVGIDVDEVNAALLAAGSSGLTVTVDGNRVLALGAEDSGDAGNVVTGHSVNSADASVGGATIAGGGYDDGSDTLPNQVTADYGTVGGGAGNTAGGRAATVGGGNGNEARALLATIGGGGALSGLGNVVYDEYGTVGGGAINQAGSDDGDPTTAQFATVGGGSDNEASGEESTAGGGANNVASGTRSTIAGGRSNETTEFASTVGGGQNCHARGQFATVGGGQWNKPTSSHATIAGGEYNEAYGRAATIGGGGDPDSNGTGNVVYDNYGTVGGGGNNRAGSDDDDPTTAEFVTVSGGEENKATSGHATVSGGKENEARSEYTTVGGGEGNEADVVGATVAGGIGNKAINQRATVGGGFSNKASGGGATVPGGRNNTAGAVSSFAAGRKAKSNHVGTFVWADGQDQEFASTGGNQFIVEAEGGVGIGTNAPKTQLHVVDSVSGTATPENHVALIENTSDGDSDDVLAVEMNQDTPGSGNNFISFKDANGPVGAIEGDGSGGVTTASAGNDYAEWLPRREPEESIEAGEVVGVHAGEVSHATADADRAMVVSTQPIVAGNDPGPAAEDREGYEKVAFIGQAPVKVRGTAAAGDLIVPSGDDDGTGRAVDPAEYRPGDGPIIGRAWEGSDDDEVTEVTVAVGLETGDALEATVEQQADWIDDQQAQIDDLEAENEQLRDRLAAVEDHLGLAGDGDPVPADD